MRTCSESSDDLPSRGLHRECERHLRKQREHPDRGAFTSRRSQTTPPSGALCARRTSDHIHAEQTAGHCKRTHPARPLVREAVAGERGGRPAHGAILLVRSMTFRRAAPATEQLLGTREWMHGHRMTSFGHSIVDAMLGGGLLLGCVNVVESAGVQADGHALALCSLFVAQGDCSGACVAIAGADGCGVASVDGFVAGSPAGGDGVSSGPSASAAPGAAADTADLRIAWQYKKYIGSSGAGSALAAPSGGGGGDGRAVDEGRTMPGAAPRASAAYCSTFDLARVRNSRPSSPHEVGSVGGVCAVRPSGSRGSLGEVLRGIADLVTANNGAFVQRMRVAVICGCMHPVCVW
jgi:hypothetical protein